MERGNDQTAHGGELASQTAIEGLARPIKKGLSRTLGYFDSDELRQVRGRAVLPHGVVLVEPHRLAELDTAGSELRLVNPDLAGAEVHGPLDFGLGRGHLPL